MTVPAELYRNAIDLNRFSNSVARRIINVYNDIIVDAVNQLKIIDELGVDDANQLFRAARLRSVLAQLKESLTGWAGDASNFTATELQGLAILQTDFVTQQLRNVIPAGSRSLVNTVEVSADFARTVVLTDPTDINTVVLSDDLFKSVYGVEQGAQRVVGRSTFNLTSLQGSAITLPNGKIIDKAFRGLAINSAEMFAQITRQGLLSGETLNQISRRLKGRLKFGDYAPLSVGQVRAAGLSIKQLQQAGGELTSVANHQVQTLVRTSVNQISNMAAMNVYEANTDITEKYQYVATLDARTTAICRALDGQMFEYGKGPEPPQHFNCRSTIVSVIDYDNLPFDPPDDEGMRSAIGGMVPADTTYGDWIAKPENVAIRVRALGKGKAAYFDKLRRQPGMNPQKALQKLVRDDGSELSLADLRSRYGNIARDN
jgi:SPP1 gp7 family putative phage head morphogenesis protein